MAFFVLWVIIEFIAYCFDIERATGAPQQAAIAAMTCVSMIFPYILIRLITIQASLLQGKEMLKNQKIMIQLLTNGELPKEEPTKKIQYWWKKPSTK